MKTLFLSACLLISVVAQAESKIVKPFCTDGCTSVPELAGRTEFDKCCVEHDYKYWKGGDIDDKAKADEDLRWCVQKMTAKNDDFFDFSTPFDLAVATFGDEYWSTAWGETKHPWTALTPQEKTLVQAQTPAGDLSKIRCR